MSTFTKNLNLEKPAQNDFYDIDVQNSNMEKIDEAINNTMPKTGGDFTGGIGIPPSHIIKFKGHEGATFTFGIDWNQSLWLMVYENDVYKGTILGVDKDGNVISGSLMPKSGGEFKGNVVALNENRAGNYIRNIEVYEKTHTDFVSTNILVAVRK